MTKQEIKENMKVCRFCNKERIIKKYIPISRVTDKPLFENNEWFFAYVKCDCGISIINKEDLIKEVI